MTSLAGRGGRRVAELVLLCVFLASAGTAPAGVRDLPTVEVDVPATPTDLSYTAANNSPAIAIDPTEARFVVIAYRADAPMFSCGLSISGDGGRSFVGANPVPKLPKGAEHCYAPEIVFDGGGTLYYLFVGLAGAGNAPMGVFLTTSSDHARSWSTPRRILGPQNYMVRLAIDPSVGSNGRLYLVWLQSSVAAPLGGLAEVVNPILVAHSDDGGHTFSKPVTVSEPARRHSVAPAVAVGPDHAVHVAYYDLGDDNRDYQGLEGPPWDGTWSIVMTSSTDRGATFSPGVVVTDAIVPPGRVMLIYTMAAPGLGAGPSGSAYVAWPDNRQAGGPDVLLARSTNGGASWEPARRLNDNPPGGAPVSHELPRIGVAPDGRVDVAFLDRRNDPENLRNDVYLTWSADGGATFGPNVRVTSESSDSRIGQGYRIPSAVGLVEIGSRLAVASRDGDALLAWPDMRNSSIGTNEQDVFAATVAMPGVGTASGRSTVASSGSGGGNGLAVGAAAAAGAAAVLVVLLVLRARRRHKFGVTTENPGS